jgi:diguanylate cyclase (GGDEF)-like protein
MVRKSRAAERSAFTILLTDDDEAYAQTTRILLEREGHTVLLAHSGEEALRMLRSRHVDLLLLDYFMNGMTGEDVVQELRKDNAVAQVILQTGYASEQPPRHLLKRLDIQGYHDKSEGPEKLLMWVDVGLKAAYSTQLVHKSRQGLRYILNVTPQLHKMQPLDELLQGIICQVTGLLGVANSFLAFKPGSSRNDVEEPNDIATFLAMKQDDAELVVHAGTGRFAGASYLVSATTEAALLSQVASTLHSRAITVNELATVVPLCVGTSAIGVIYLDKPIQSEQDLELLSVFANQAAVAVHNSQLFEMATVDPLTGTYLRRFMEQWIVRELRTAFRQKQAIALLMVDMDGLKRINDTAGHLYGDEALANMGRILRQTLRESDMAGRYGGDEFIVALPQTGRGGAEHVGNRILELLQHSVVRTAGAEFPVRGSIGLVSLEARDFAECEIGRPIGKDYFQQMLKEMVEAADAALYTAKKEGRGQLCFARELRWPDLPMWE